MDTLSESRSKDTPTIGERLRTARQTKGWSTRTVAEALQPSVKVSHATIGNYERDATTPPADVLAALAALYDRTPNWFLGDVPVLSGVRYRNLKSKVGVRDRQQLEGACQRWLDAYVAIERHLDRPLENERWEHLTGLELKADTPDQAASQLRNTLSLKEEDPFPSVIDVLEGIGVRVIDAETDLAVDGIAGRLGDEHAVVLNGDVSNDRSRMNAAHELAHVLFDDCHEDDGECEKETEKAAFEFASHLLITTPMLEQAFRGKSMVRLLQFKERYGLSLAAMVYRAGADGILSERYTKRLWIEFSRRGWRRKEPGSVRADRPIRFETLIDSAIAEQDISLHSLADVGGVRTEELRRRLSRAMGFDQETGHGGDDTTDTRGLRLAR